MPYYPPETVDDYEEGAWTPVLAFGGASTGITYSIQLARYTKIGRVVCVECRISLTSKGSATGAATISGLPFTSNPALPSASLIASPVTMNTLNVPSVQIAANSTSMSLVDFNGTTTVSITDANFNNTSTFRAGGFYMV